MLQYRLFLLLVFLVCIYSAPPGQEVDKSKPWKQWKGAPKDCVGSELVTAKVSRPIEAELEKIRRQYEGCTVVFGNLIISHLDEERIVNFTTQQLENALGFLNDIEQVTGYVMIFLNGLETLNFKNLKVIWGDQLHGGAALTVEGNPQLRALRMPSLRSIERGKVVVGGSPNICYLKNTIDFSELLGADYKKRLNFKVFNYREVETEEGRRCSKSHSSFRCHEKCKKCWGPEEDSCQTIYRSGTPSNCMSGMHYFEKSTGQKICCDEACAGGCYGRGKNECVACKKLRQDNKCVERCNGLKDYDAVSGRTFDHPDPRYTHNRFCVRDCPPKTIIEGEYCVERCSSGSYYDVNDEVFTCKPCPNGLCPKECELHEELSSLNIHQLKDCTRVEGSIFISPEAFIETARYDENDLRLIDVDQNDTMETKVPPITEADLEILSTIEVVTEHVEISMGIFSPESLSFLRSLTTIVGKRDRMRYSLKIDYNRNLRSLGLTSLKKIIGGRAYIGDNSYLCFTDTLNKTMDEIIKEVPEPGMEKYRIHHNRDKALCDLINDTCSKTCDQEYGCWGKKDTECVKCKVYSDGKRCMNECLEHEGYYKSGSMCLKCDELCATCFGPGSTQCSKCRYYTWRRGEGRQCVRSCPNNTYAEGGLCKDCDKACNNKGCTGDSDYVMEGGCYGCIHGVHDVALNKTRCLYAESTKSKDVCEDNGLTSYFLRASNLPEIEEYECHACDRLCVTCTSSGFDSKESGCICKFDKVINDNAPEHYFCADGCPKGTRVLRERISASDVGECKRCHSLCDSSYSCTGDNATSCERCQHAGILEDNQQTCLNECPPGMQLFGDKNKICHNVDPLAVQKRKKQVLVVSIVLGVLVLLAVAAALAWNCWKYRTRYRQEKQLNPPLAIPECEPVDPDAKPNMAQLCLISNEHLTKTSKPLGRGAFGIVYAGYWWPNKKGGEKVVVAIKVVQDPTGQAQKEMLAEAGIMASMRHEHLLRLVGVCLSNGIQLVTPLRPLGSLREFLIKHHQKLGARDLLLYCYQISSAMEYLFKNRLVHRDLAARNVLVKRTNHVEVTDFGLAKMLEKGKNEVIVNGKVAVKWLALESLRHRVYNHSTDVWAFGVTCWEVMTFGQTPYPNIGFDKMLGHLEAGNRLEQPNNCAQDVYQVLVQCWLENPESRPTFVILKKYFENFCRAPHRYVVLEREVSSDLINCDNQRELINELMEDNEDFTDPLAYFDEHSGQTTANTIVPLTPTTPGWSTGDDPSSGGCGTILLARHDRRLTSTGSARYQVDPVHGTSSAMELNTDEGNYLVPNTKQTTGLLYTPVVIHENGESELLNSQEYYNDPKAAEYYNDLKNNDDKLPMISSIENKDYFAESVTSV